jgi:hypothetical protein
MIVVGGIDASYTGLGLVAVAGDWSQEFARVKRKTLSTGPGDGPLVVRVDMLADDVCRWLEWARGPHELRVTFEAGLSHAGKGDSVRTQSRLLGALELELYQRLKVIASHAEQATIRKLLLGFEPRSDKKAAVHAVLEQLTPTRWDPNEYCAFAAANVGLAEAGLAFVSVAPDAAKGAA